MKNTKYKIEQIQTLKFSVLLILLLLQTLVSAQNSYVWQKCYGGAGSSSYQNMCRTDDGGYFLIGNYGNSGGDFSGNYGMSDIGLIKIDANGNKLWSTHYGSDNLEGSAVIIKGFGGKYYIIGNTYFYGYPNFHGFPEAANKSDGFVICIDSLGAILWQHCYGGYGNDQLYTGVVIDSNFLYAAGFTIKSNGGDTGGNYDSDTILGSYDVFICKIDATNGNLIHANRLGGTDNDYIHKMIVTDNDKLLLLGNSSSNDINVPNNNGMCDAWALKIDTSFNVISSKIWGGSKKDEFYDATNITGGGYMLFGCSENTDTLTGNLDFVIGSGTKQLMLIKTNSNFVSQWQKSYGCNIFDISSNGLAPNAFIQTSDNGFLMGAYEPIIASCPAIPFTNGHTVFIKANSAGNQMFERHYGCDYSGGHRDILRSIIETNDGGIIVGAQGHVDSNNSCSNPGINPNYIWNIYKLDNILGVEQNFNESGNIQIYPNPANDILNIDGLTNKFEATVFDLKGKLIIRKQHCNSQLDISYLAKGLYFIKLTTEKVSFVRKFVKE